MSQILIAKTLLGAGLGICIVFFPLLTVGQSPITSRFVNLTHRASNGDVIAQVELGADWIAGDYGRRDYVQAVHWFEAACAQGSADGCAWLGSCKIMARGTALDPEIGTKLVNEAISTGSSVGLRVKADLISSGKWPKPHDGPPIADLYSIAALQGDAIANDKVGSIYLEGRGLRRDLNKAAKFFYLGSLLGNADAQLHLGQMYESSLGFDDPMPYGERSGRSSIEMAMYFYNKASEKNNRIAQYRWASILRSRPSSEQDVIHARALYEASSVHQYGIARLALAQMLEAGQGGPADLPRALSLFWDAADKSVPGADDAARRLHDKASSDIVAAAEVKLKLLRQLDSRFQK
ncbi:MAG TPA: hypothetical protein VK578_19635 [Edaphobacter sp.]|nr:hypothetical protein [Edaphobacter sp.]